MFPSFKQYNQRLGSKKVLFIKKTGCPPCTRLEPSMQTIANKYNGLIQTVSLDTAYDPSIYEKYNVDATPTILFVYNGKLVGKVEGADIKAILYEYDKLARML